MFKGVAWEQISGLVQRLLMFGAGIAVAKGWISEVGAAQLVGAFLAIAGVAWGVKVNTEAALTASVDGLSSVKGVIPKNTVDGRALVEAVASPTVKAAGTFAAAEIAKPTPTTEK